MAPCNGRNSRMVFPQQTRRIYLRYQYERIPTGAAYIRTWRQGGETWIRYECTWRGPESGDFDFRLNEPGGLRSGPWEITVEVNDVTVLNEEFEIGGDWSFWEPVGLVTNKCNDFYP